MKWTELLKAIQSTGDSDPWAILFIICEVLDEQKIPLPKYITEKETSPEEKE